MKKYVLTALLLVAPAAAILSGSELIPPVTDMSDKARKRLESYRALSKTSSMH